jgi:hypothetical protein
MRSYYSHLQAVKSTGEEISLSQKPVFRSSAVFPVIHNKHYFTRIMFMGYWLVKRNITEIGLLYTLRNKKGIIISRKYLLIDSAKAFTIEIGEFAEHIQKNNDINDFTGSLELEIFSTKDLVFPYPAFVLVYYNEHFSTAVHTAGRIYNDLEDLKVNEEYKVRESGFDIYGEDKFEPFIALTNGPIKNEKPTLQYKVNNMEGVEFEGGFSIPPLDVFETTFIKLKKYIDLKKMLSGKCGSIKFGHNFEGFFPRFIVGNMDTNANAISITHSYYDCSELNDAKSYWNRIDENFDDSSVAVPLYLENDFYTHLAIYPIFSPSNFTLSFDFYDQHGKLEGTLIKYKPVRSIDNKYDIIDFGKIIAQENLNVTSIKSVNIKCNWEDKTKIPTRIKFGMNVGIHNREIKFPSNICFAPSLGNPKILQKKGTFRWAPFINIGKSEIILTNFAPLKSYDKAANIILKFYREQDDTIVERKICIKANAIETIRSEEDKEIKEFFSNHSGWLTIDSDNAFVNGWYYDFHESGSVAADHVF